MVELGPGIDRSDGDDGDDVEIPTRRGGTTGGRSGRQDPARDVSPEPRPEAPEEDAVFISDPGVRQALEAARRTPRGTRGPTNAEENFLRAARSTPERRSRLDETATIRNLSAAQSARERREFLDSQEDPRAGRAELGIPGTDRTVEDIVEDLARGFTETFTEPAGDRARAAGDVFSAVVDDPGVLSGIRVEAGEETGGFVLDGVDEGTPEGRTAETFVESLVELGNVPRATREIDEIAVEPAIEIATGGPVGEAPERASDAFGVGRRAAEETFSEFFVAEVSEERLDMLREGDVGSVEDDPLFNLEVRPGREAEVGGAAAAGLVSLFGSVGAISGASRVGGPRAGRAVSVAIQPGEELVFEAARRGAIPARAASLVPGVSRDRVEFGSGVETEIRPADDFRVSGELENEPIGAGLGSLAARQTRPQRERLEIVEPETDLDDAARRISIEFEGEFDRRVPVGSEIRRADRGIRAENPFIAEGGLNIPRDPLDTGRPIGDPGVITAEGDRLLEIAETGELLGEPEGILQGERDIGDEIETTSEVLGETTFEAVAERELETVVEVETPQETEISTEAELVGEVELSGEARTPFPEEEDELERRARGDRFRTDDEVFSSGFRSGEELLDEF